MAERDFVERLEKSGFTGIEVLQRRPWGIDDCARYPLFDADLIALMRRVIPEDRHDRVAESIVIRAELGRRLPDDSDSANMSYVAAGTKGDRS